MRLRRILGFVSVLTLVAACDAAPPAPSFETAGDAMAAPVAAPVAEARSTDGGLAVMIAEPAPVMAIDPSTPVSSDAPGTGLVRAGVLTAGDIDDGLNLNAFNTYARAMRASTGLPLSNLVSPVLARLVGPDGAPAVRQRVTLRLPGAETPFWDGYSGVGGVITVFPAVMGAGSPGQVEMRVFPPGQGEPVVQTLATGATRATVQLPFGSAEPGFLDLVFVLDATGSMGDELDWLTRDLNSMVTAARVGYGSLDIRFGLIVYRDTGDEYVVRAYDFMGSASAMRQTLRAQQAVGGGDYPEAAADALAAAMGLSWRRGQGERLLFHIADAPPHDSDAGRYLAAARTAAAQGVQIFGLGASGVADESEYLMRQAALITGGRYLFLTDDSGVGSGHAEPRISCYVVTELRAAMIRAIRSEIVGQRVEPTPGDIVRQVGSYQNGVCRD